MINNLKIIIVGAGHGGLIASAKLALAGYDVTVYEVQNRCDLGHDAEDGFSIESLEHLIGIKVEELPPEIWRSRGDAAFYSPNQSMFIPIHYHGDSRKIMWRKPLINLLIDYALECGVKINFGVRALGPIVKDDMVVGVKLDCGDVLGDLVIDSAGVFSPIRSNLPAEFHIEREPRYGDLFYSYRAYFDLAKPHKSDIPFEVYLYHEGEKGLSWLNTNEDSADILIGRIYKLTDEKINEQLEKFRKKRPWVGEKILHGGNRCVIPVRRPLTKFVAKGYAAVGDSAFMTTPMNGMGIDLSMRAGCLLARTIINSGDVGLDTLWKYNCRFHRFDGGEIAKNEGLKNTIISMPANGIDFLFENKVIESSDLAGAGQTTKMSALLGKFIRGMRAPKYFFTLLGGLIRGAKVAKLYRSAPKTYSLQAINKWSDKIAKLDIRIAQDNQ